MNEQTIRAILEGDGGAPGRMLRAALWLPGKAYGLAMRLRRRMYESGVFGKTKAGVPVVSVGNLTVGGAGKTPFCAMLYRHLASMGRKPAILARGYRPTSRGESDEVLLYRRLLPGAVVETGGDRAASAKRAIAGGADVLILDDGFQHLRLERDLDIVLIDASSPWGGGNVLPGGLLREPREALGRAGAVVLTRTEQVEPEEVDRLVETIRGLCPGREVFRARHVARRLWRVGGEALSLDELNARRVVAVSGIARPEAFARTLEALGAEIVESVAFSDHHDFSPAEMTQIAALATAEDAVVVVTEKDAVKLAGLSVPDGGVWALGIEQEVLNLGRLLELVRGAL